MIITIYDVALLVAIALIFSRILGFIFDKIKQPIVIGEIISGIILGFVGSIIFSGKSFSFFNINFTISEINYTSYEFELLATIGILFLLFISGLETSLSKLKKTGKAASFSAISGVILPLLLGISVGIFFNFPLQDCIVIGLILTATSVGITVRTLLDIHVLDTDVGTTILGAAVIDDVIGIMLLAFS
ncbi:MAG: cation:proton antiporter [Thermoplasmatota archaeon]